MRTADGLGKGGGADVWHALAPLRVRSSRAPAQRGEPPAVRRALTEPPTHAGCRKQLWRSQLVRAVSPISTTRIACGGQARAAAGAPAPCSSSAHVRLPLHRHEECWWSMLNSPQPGTSLTQPHTRCSPTLARVPLTVSRGRWAQPLLASPV
eukprot:5198678-Prymnesium_polylepis.1